MTNTLPSRLIKAPLMEAIFEIRFQSEIPVSNILPGYLYSELKCTSIDKLPSANLPPFVLDADPNLKYTQTIRLKWEDFNIQVGDRSMLLSCDYPYPGWLAFKTRITTLLKVVEKLQVVKGIERFSIKAINLFPFDEYPSLGDGLAFKLLLGNTDLFTKATSFRTEIHKNDLISIIQLAGHVNVKIHTSNMTKEGMLLDLDTIKTINSVSLHDFIANADEFLSELHDVNKSLFFECLTEKGLAALEPA